MVDAPGILFGKVMHKRIFPKVNQFTYGIYYISVPISDIHSLNDGVRFGVNRAGLLSFHEKDHGDRSGGNLEIWARKILEDWEIGNADGQIVLLTMPRVLGYVFNPVSFWLCFDTQKKLRAVICEVNNTFGETHSYICARDDGAPIEKEDSLETGKVFHVSPFLEREGHYKFRFSYTEGGFGAWIDFYDEKGEKKLLTSLMGRFAPWSRKERKRAFWGYPLVTLKAIALIHFQAARILLKKINYVSKPVQKPERTSVTRYLD